MLPDLVPLRAVPGGVEILDQVCLPHREVRVVLRDVASLCEAIRSLAVRGAPLLGLAGAAGIAIAAEHDPSDASLAAAAQEIERTRPTAIDLGAAVRRSLALGLAAPAPARPGLLWQEFERLLAQQRRADRAIGRLGAALVPQGAAVLTHCNAGALATGGIGTALGIVRTAWEQGRLLRCYATETRPLLQGARLTAWELTRLGIPVTLVPDTAAASLIASGRVQAVITGADRVAANGDTANKIGTFGLALAAARAGVPFYIAAPATTLDPACPSGEEIPIEFRDASEVGGFAGERWGPAGADAYNPAFDVTPAELITAIITERRVIRPPFAGAIAADAAAAEGPPASVLPPPWAAVDDRPQGEPS